MVTLRREAISDTKTRDYDRTSLNRDNYAHSTRAKTGAKTTQKPTPEYLDYLWAELERKEPRKTLRPNEYNMSRRLESGESVRQDNRNIAHRTIRSHNISQSRESINGRLDKKGVVAIVAYFLIVAVIATLIIVNGAGGAAFDPATGSQAELSVGAGNEIDSTTELPIIPQEVLGTMVLNDGSVQDINLLDKSDSYAYQSSTNWFDKLCDAISFIAGG